MTVARYLERHGLLEECISWLQQHYPKVERLLENKSSFCEVVFRGGICPCRQCRRQCKIFASGVNFSHFFVFFLVKLLKLGKGSTKKKRFLPGIARIT